MLNIMTEQVFLSISLVFLDSVLVQESGERTLKVLNALGTGP